MEERKKERMFVSEVNWKKKQAISYTNLSLHLHYTVEQTNFAVFIDAMKKKENNVIGISTVCRVAKTTFQFTKSFFVTNWAID